MRFKLFFSPSRLASRTPRRAQSLVEFALVVPVLLTLLLGIIEFGVYAKNSQTLANAAREGARAAAVGRPIADIEARVRNQAAPIPVVAPNGSITIQTSTNNGASYTTIPADSNGRNGAPSGSLVRVIAVTNNRSITGFFGNLFGQTIRGSVVMRREG